MLLLFSCSLINIIWADVLIAQLASLPRISAQVVAGPERLPRDSLLCLPWVTDACGELLFDLNQIVLELTEEAPCNTSDLAASSQGLENLVLST